VPLKANGEDIKVVQELLRHANSRTTLDIYTQALTPAKREAQTKIANLILPKKSLVGESLTNPFNPHCPRQRVLTDRKNGRHVGTRTPDLYRVKNPL
jgi:hypothetical protein